MTESLQGLRIPADIFAVKLIGIEAWRSRFYWPVSDAEYADLANLVLDRFDQMILALNPHNANLFLCDSAFTAFLIQHVHALLVQERVRRLGAELVFSGVSSVYRPNWAARQEPFVLEYGIATRWKLRLREIAKGAAFSPSRPFGERLMSALGKSEYVCVGSFSNLLESYLEEKLKASCSYVYPHALIRRPNASSPSPPDSELEGAVWSLLETLRLEIRDRFDLGLDVRQAAICWLRRIECIRGAEKAIRTTMRTPQQLLCTEPANPLHKVFSKVVLEEGGKVSAFAHGNDPGLLTNRMSGYVQMSMCDEFVCPSASSTDLYQDVLSLTPIRRLRKVEHVSLKDNQFQLWHRQFAKHRTMTLPRVVMVIGYPMNPTRYVLSQGDFFLFQLDLELQILRCLRRMGLSTIYKMHPERVREAAGIFERECDEVMIAPFEKVWSAADAFVFPCTTSTTFGFALCTPRPIVVVDLPGLRWNPKVYPSLAKRCRMVPATIGPENRLNLDQGEFARALGPEAGNWDDHFVTEFMYPSAGPQ